VNQFIALFLGFTIIGVAVVTVLLLVLFPRATEDKPYEDEFGVLIPCGCGCGDTP
jgi:hypothetical protein